MGSEWNLCIKHSSLFFGKMVYNEKLAVCDIHEVVVEETSMAAFAHRDYFSSTNSREAKNNLEKENLCLYGFPSEQWEVNLPAEEVPPELPEPALGINFARDGMQEKDWLSLVSVHGDAWLLSMAFYFAKENKASKVMHEEDIRSDESIPDTDDDEQQDFDEIKDPRQQADAVNKVLEEVIQLPALWTFWLYVCLGELML
ncbi:PHD finger protein ALFIN-LIKE [Trifolium repens]|nr:PHD finger protein ALFIN-LIKE [Trifolium repens]